MKKVIAVLLCLTLCCALLAGCGSSEASSAAASSAEAVSSVEEPAAEEPAAEEPAAEEPAAEEPAPAEEAAAEEAVSAEEPAESDVEEPAEDETFDPQAILAEVDDAANPIQFPLEEPEQLTCWISVNDRLMQDLPEGQDAVRPFMAMEDYTGVDIVWTQVSAQLADTQFQLMVAGGDYTDIMINVADMYNTGLDAAVEDDVFLAVNDYLEEYAPNYNALVYANDQTMSECLTDAGNVVAFYGFADKPAQVGSGLVIRQDFLDAVGMDIPATYDEYHDVLTAFKNDLGIEEPLYLPCSGFYGNEYLVGGYGIAGKVSSMPTQSDPWYQVDGEVRFGAVQPEMKEYLTMMHQWYEEGLISPDFVSVNQYDSDNNINATDQVGVFFLEIEMAWSSLDAAEKENPDWAITPIAEPVRNEGDTVHFANETTLTDGGGIVVSTACSNVELAVAWCDSWFSEAGQLAANYGMEGESYTIENGEPVYTDLALEGNNLNVMYSCTIVPTIYIRDKLAYTYSEFETSCYDVWSAARDDVYTYSGNAQMTVDESDEYASIMSDIHTYLEEHITKFITGDESLDDFDSFVETIEGMDLARATELKQAALDRYLGVSEG